MKEIKLTKGLTAIVDDESYDFLNQWKWCAVKKQKYYYAQRKKVISGKSVTIQMHRLIMQVNEKHLVVDHRNHNTLDNTKENLRVCAWSENAANKIPRKNCTSKYLGVCWLKSRNRWLVQIQKNGKKLKIGTYRNEAEAALAYNEKAIMLHGEFANINKIAS